MRPARPARASLALAAAAGMAACAGVGLDAALHPTVAAACSAANCPVINSTAPGAVSTDAGPSVIRIFGQGFGGVSTVYLEPEDQPVTFTGVSAEEVDATLPPRTGIGDHWFVVQTSVGSSQANPPAHVRVIPGKVGASAAGVAPVQSLPPAPSVGASMTPAVPQAAGVVVPSASGPRTLPWLYIVGIAALAVVCGIVATLRLWSRSEVGLRLLRRRAAPRRRRDRDEQEIFDDRIRRL